MSKIGGDYEYMQEPCVLTVNDSVISNEKNVSEIASLNKNGDWKMDMTTIEI